MFLVIDGFNLIYKFIELEEYIYYDKLDEAKLGLLKILEKFQKKRKQNTHIYVFFDGKKTKGSTVVDDEFGEIKIHYSHDLTADHYIKLYVRSQPNPGSITVVSSDKNIMLFCQKYKAKVQKSEDFAKWVESFFKEEEKELEEKSESIKLSEKEIDYWKKLFSQKK